MIDEKVGEIYIGFEANGGVKSKETRVCIIVRENVIMRLPSTNLF